MTQSFPTGETDRRSRRLTVLWCAVTAIVLLTVWLLWGEGGYMIAWTASLAGAILLLHIMSIPRRTIVGDTALEIHCIVEITRIEYADLRSIRRVGPDALHNKYVLLGGYGFFGYYGYYFDFMEWTTYKVYASDRKHLVLIEDIYEDRFIVSCNDPETFIKHVQEYRDRKRSEILRHTQQGGQSDRSETNP